jgi:hypothetical protein
LTRRANNKAIHALALLVAIDVAGRVCYADSLFLSKRDLRAKDILRQNIRNVLPESRLSQMPGASTGVCVMFEEG